MVVEKAGRILLGLSCTQDCNLQYLSHGASSVEVQLDPSGIMSYFVRFAECIEIYYVSTNADGSQHPMA
jgi:hypothetical protein